jgi:hypothetical protein
MYHSMLTTAAWVAAACVDHLSLDALLELLIAVPSLLIGWARTAWIAVPVVN